LPAPFFDLLKREANAPLRLLRIEIPYYYGGKPLLPIKKLRIIILFHLKPIIMSQFISLQDAIDMTSRYRTYKETILASTYKNLSILPVCESFDRDVFDDILVQNDCTRVRIYLGMDSNYKVKMVFVGVDSKNEDILPTGSELIAEDGFRCPTQCPPSSPLNS